MAGAKGAGNVTATYNNNVITAYLSQVQLQGVIAEIEATNMASTAEEFEPGLASWTATLDLVNWDSTLDGYLAPDVTSPGTKRTFVLAFSDANSTTVTYTWTSKAFLTNYSIQAQPSAMISNPGVGIRLNGAPTRT